MHTVRAALREGVARFSHLAIPEAVIESSTALEQYNPAHQSRWAARTWETLRSMDRYAAATTRAEQRFHGSFFTYCTCSPDASISARIVKMSESKNLRNNDRLIALRHFPVDQAVSADGEVFMESHVAIQLVGNPAPRLYFLDDVRGPTGKIHIGYVGKHLDNLKTARSM